MSEFEKVFDKLFELHMHGDLNEFKSKYKTLFNKVILKSVEIHTNSLMKELYSESLEVIDGYLNAGCKDQRKKVHQAGRAYYRKVTGTDYLNKNERK